LRSLKKSVFPRSGAYAIAGETRDRIGKVNIILFVIDSLFEQSSHHYRVLVVDFELFTNLFLKFGKDRVCGLCISGDTDDFVFSLFWSCQNSGYIAPDVVKVS
jgi:hypothetical protein